MRIEKISAVTFRALSMKASVQFYCDVLGMELVYGGERAGFSSLRAKDADSAILNLEQGRSVSGWGRLIFHVADADAFWAYLCEKDFTRKGRETRHGVNGIFTCPIRMGMSYRSRVRSSSLPTTA